MSTLTEHVEVDFLLLADRAEILNGKLYMMGGAWDRRFVSNIEAPVPLSIAIGVLVPWNLTNEQHTLEIRIVDDDGDTILPTPTVTLNVGRPIQSTKGQSFRAMAVVNAMWKLPQFGAYCIVVSIAGQEAKRVTFYAVDAQKTKNPA